MSVKQSIEIETKNHTTLMMGGSRQQDNSTFLAKDSPASKRSVGGG